MHVHARISEQVTVSAKAADSRRAGGGVVVNVSIAMDNQNQAAAAAAVMTTAAINSQLQAVSLPAAAILSAPSVIASKGTPGPSALTSAGPHGAGLHAALAALAALAGALRGTHRLY